MKHARKAKDPQEAMFIGLLLMLAGTIFLLAQLDLVQLGEIWHWWPILVIAIGAARLFRWRSADGVASGLSWVLFGFWFLANIHEWFGMTWRKSWPLGLVVVGLEMIVRSLLEPVFRRRERVDVPAGGESNA
jgi:hypothetical protein